MSTDGLEGVGEPPLEAEIASLWSGGLEQVWSSLVWPSGTPKWSKCPRTLWNPFAEPFGDNRPVILQKGPLGACGQEGPPRALICRSVASQISSEARPPPKRMKRVGIGKAPQA